MYLFGRHKRRCSINLRKAKLADVYVQQREARGCYVLHTGIAWEDLPQELGFGSGMTCWRRLRDWQAAGVWEKLHLAILIKLREHDQIDWNRASIDGASVASPQGARKQAQTRQIVEN